MAVSAEGMAAPGRLRAFLQLGLGGIWLIFQLYILLQPVEPLVERPVHLTLALALALLWLPLGASRQARILDGLLLAGVAAVGVYYLGSVERLSSHMDGVDPIYAVDLIGGTLLIVLLLEAVRRIVGWSLLSVILIFLAYAFIGPWLPGWFGFSGFGFADLIEILTMTLYGVLGITTETSVQFVFYFVLFGAVYSAIGGGQLLIDLALGFTGRSQGGAAKAAVVSSSLMGGISGSAVANVTATGVFTIPLMRKAGYAAERAAAIEAIASTGGQLMPPIMGVAAFVMAEILQIDYAVVALAGLAPAAAFYLAIFLIVDLESRRDRIGTIDAARTGPIRPRLHLLIPPVALLGMLIAGYSATLAATAATALCLLVCYLRRSTWLDGRDWRRALDEGTRQAALVAAPIAAIGIIMAIAVQSNLALKFSSQLIDQGGGGLILSLLLIALGCLVMGAGLPTVAAYIIGAILFAPALVEAGVHQLAAHMFVFYYCVLSMVTPPVALASYAAAGLAGASTMTTSLEAFRLSFVSFLIPFAFVFDPRLLADGSSLWVLAAFASLAVATAGWAVALAGWLRRRLNALERCLLAAGAVATILLPTGTLGWLLALAALGGIFAWIWAPERKAADRTASAELR